MLNDSIKTLAATPPPSRGKFTNALQADAKIRELETQLGLPNGNRRILDIRAANQRVNDLEQLVKTIATHAETAKPTGIGLAQLSALHSLVFGAAETETLLTNRANYKTGLAEMSKASAKIEAARQAYGDGPATEKAAIARAELSEKLRAERAGTDTAKITRLTQNFAEAGLHVPGLSFCGLKIAASSGEGRMSGRELADAQCTVAEFMACVSPDAGVDEITSTSPAALAARQILTATGRINDGKITL